MIQIRTALGSDAPDLQKLNDLFNGANSNALSAIQESLQTNTSEIVCVAADGNRLVGFCCGQVYKSMCYPFLCAEITELFVLDGHRRQGIGKRLLARMESELTVRGARHLHILTNGRNIAAKTLYRSFGYAETAEVLLDKNTG